MTWVDRIAARLDELGWSQAELARRSGVPHTTIRKYLSAQGGGIRQPRTEKLKRIAQALGTTPEWILFGAGSGKVAISERQLPVWRLSDLGDVMDVEVGTRKEAVPISMMAAPPGAQEADLWVEVDDPAMEPEIPFGAYALVSRETQVRPGDLVIAKELNTGAYLIRRYRIVSIAQGVRTISLAAANPAYGEIITTGSDEYTIVGRIVGKFLPV